MNIRPVLVTIVFSAIALIALLQLMKPPTQTYNLASTMTNNLQSLVTYTPSSAETNKPTPSPTATSFESPTPTSTPLSTVTATPTSLPTVTITEPPTPTSTPLPTATDTFTSLSTTTITKQSTPTATIDEQSEKTGQANILIYQGLKYTSEKQYALAIQAYEESIYLSPNADAYAGLGSVYLILEQPEPAIQNIQEAIKLDPGNHTNYYYLAQVLQYQQKFIEALENYSKAIELGTDQLDAYQSRALLHGVLNDIPAMLSDLDHFIEKSSDDSLGHFYRGLAYYRNKEYEKALVDLDKAIELDPFHQPSQEYRTQIQATYVASQPTITPVITAQSMLAQPTVTPIPLPTTVPTYEVCACRDDYYDCSMFSGPSHAQVCYDYCVAQGAGDVHQMDPDGDSLACLVSNSIEITTTPTPIQATSIPTYTNTPITVVTSTFSQDSFKKCPCNGDYYDCHQLNSSSSFTAQECYDQCKSQGFGDPHNFDPDGDGIACFDSLLNITPIPPPPCLCIGDIYNCGYFFYQKNAQKCFDYCWEKGKGDIHRLDYDNDGYVCEKL